MTIDREPSAQPVETLSDSARVRVCIARAKFEWETTVDALPDLISGRAGGAREPRGRALEPRLDQRCARS